MLYCTKDNSLFSNSPSSERLNFNVSSSNNEVTGFESVVTNHFPSANEPQIVKAGTGVKGFLRIEKRGSSIQIFRR